MPIRTKRWNDPPDPADGYRLLVCRYRPRGVKKEGEPWDAWLSALGPSPELHAAVYGKHAERIAWDVYVARFFAEMSRQRYWIEGFAARVRAGETITLLCSSACVDPERCHRTLLASMIERAAFPPPEAARPAGVVRRGRASPATGSSSAPSREPEES